MTAPLRITFVLPTLDMTGGGRVAALYADRLTQRGHRVCVVATREPGPSVRDVLRSLIKHREWPWAKSAGPSHFDGLACEIRRLNHVGPVTNRDVPDADVVVATWWETAEWVAGLSRQKGAKVHFVQDYETWGGPLERIDASYRLPLAKIVIAEWLRDLLIQRFGQSTLALVANSVDTRQFFADPRGKQAVPTVGLTYTSYRRKGTDISIAAYEKAAKAIPGLRLRTCGNGPPSPDLPLPAGAEFTLKARDGVLRGLYAGCDAWLFGTRSEGFGLPILEAMACRTPVIGTPAGAAPELLARGGGALVPPEDPDAMAEAIVRICRLPDADWRALSDAALATATAYSWEQATDRFESALRRAADESAG